MEESPSVEPSPGPTSEDGQPPTSPTREGPGTVSITATMSPALKRLISAWLLFNHNDETKQILVEPSPVQLTHVFAEEASEHVAQLLETIDLSRSELVSINADTYKDFLVIGQVQERLIGLDGNFTIVFRRIGADEFIKQVIFLKPVLEQDQSSLSPEDNGTDNQVQPSVGDFDGVIPCLRQPKEADASVAVSPNRPEEESADNNDETGGVVEEQSGSNNDINTTTTSTTTAGSTSSGNVGTELCIGPISDRGTTWQRYSPLEQGDRILSLNGKDDHVADLPSQEAELVIETMYTCSPYLSIVVNTPPSKRQRKGSGWRAKLIKGAVAVGGGTMVGAGAILMVTPLHPIGHAMAIGGVGVLGSQYEQPRRLANRASSSFSNLANRVSSSSFANRVRISMQGRNQTEAVTTEDDDDSEESIHTAETECTSDHSDVEYELGDEETML